MEVVLSYIIGPLCVDKDENVHRYEVRGENREIKRVRERQRKAIAK